MENFKNEAPNNSPEKEMSLEEKVEKLEFENKELKDKLDNREKLLRILSHDLRLPVGTTTVFIDHLLEGMKNNTTTDKEILPFLEVISKQSRDTYKLLEDLLSWVKTQQEGVNIEITEIELNEQIKDAIAPLVEIAKKKEIKLENKVESVDMKVFADRNMLNTIIRNLINNAIKYTKKGGNISISSFKKGEVVEISIADDGVGLTQKAKDEIFSNLTVSKDGTEGEKGTRFGLSVCKDFIEQMNGSIRVESEGEGRGTTFIITLPIEQKELVK